MPDNKQSDLKKNIGDKTQIELILNWKWFNTDTELDKAKNSQLKVLSEQLTKQKTIIPRKTKPTKQQQQQQQQITKIETNIEAVKKTFKLIEEKQTDGGARADFNYDGTFYAAEVLSPAENYRIIANKLKDNNNINPKIKTLLGINYRQNKPPKHPILGITKLETTNNSKGEEIVGLEDLPQTVLNEMKNNLFLTAQEKECLYFLATHFSATNLSILVESEVRGKLSEVRLASMVIYKDMLVDIEKTEEIERQAILDQSGVSDLEPEPVLPPDPPVVIAAPRDFEPLKTSFIENTANEKTLNELNIDVGTLKEQFSNIVTDKRREKQAIESRLELLFKKSDEASPEPDRSGPKIFPLITEEDKEEEIENKIQEIKNQIMELQNLKEQGEAFNKDIELTKTLVTKDSNDKTEILAKNEKEFNKSLKNINDFNETVNNVNDNKYNLGTSPYFTVKEKDIFNRSDNIGKYSDMSDNTIQKVIDFSLQEATEIKTNIQKTKEDLEEKTKKTLAELQGVEIDGEIEAKINDLNKLKDKLEEERPHFYDTVPEPELEKVRDFQPLIDANNNLVKHKEKEEELNTESAAKLGEDTTLVDEKNATKKDIEARYNTITQPKKDVEESKEDIQKKIEDLNILIKEANDYNSEIERTKKILDDQNEGFGQKIEEEIKNIDNNKKKLYDSELLKEEEKNENFTEEEENQFKDHRYIEEAIVKNKNINETKGKLITSFSPFSKISTSLKENFTGEIDRLKKELQEVKVDGMETTLEDLKKKLEELQKDKSEKVSPPKEQKSVVEERIRGKGSTISNVISHAFMEGSSRIEIPFSKESLENNFSASVQETYTKSPSKDPKILADALAKADLSSFAKLINQNKEEKDQLRSGCYGCVLKDNDGKSALFAINVNEYDMEGQGAYMDFKTSDGNWFTIDLPSGDIYKLNNIGNPPELIGKPLNANEQKELQDDYNISTFPGEKGNGVVGNKEGFEGIEPVKPLMQEIDRQIKKAIKTPVGPPITEVERGVAVEQVVPAVVQQAGTTQNASAPIQGGDSQPLTPLINVGTEASVVNENPLDLASSPLLDTQHNTVGRSQ